MTQLWPFIGPWLRAGASVDADFSVLPAANAVIVEPRAFPRMNAPSSVSVDSAA
jgi:hypothetical protein